MTPASDPRWRERADYKGAYKAGCKTLAAAPTLTAFRVAACCEVA